MIDVRDPMHPRAVNYLGAPPNTWNIHLQTHGDLLLVINARDMFAAAEFADEHAYYKGQLGKVVGTAAATPAAVRNWTAGLAVYDISQPAQPRRIGLMPAAACRACRCGRWASRGRNGRACDFRLERGIAAVEPVPEKTANQIRDYIA